MTLSVVVVSQGSPGALADCRSALEHQAVDQVLVSEGDLELPALRWALIDQLDGDIIACLEARSVPAPDWAERIRAAHTGGPETIGGVVRPASDANPFALAQYFSDHVVAAVPSSAAQKLSDANVSYKRSYVERFRQRFVSGEWETALHLEAAARGELALVDARVTYDYDGITRSQAISERYRHGRDYAARSTRRAFRIGLAPLLPFVLTARALSSARRAGLSLDFFRALPWTFVLHLSWACGEAAGGLLGETPLAHAHRH